jgi:hypothetical protein
MMVDLTQSDIDSLQNLVNVGNYSQFYFELYQSGSTISGLYIPGPTGQGLFGNYSHEYVREVIGRDLFEQERATISLSIAEGLLEAIRATGQQGGTYRLLSDVEFLEEEIRIFTDVLGYPTEAYPGHDLIDWNNLEVNGAIDVSLIPGRGWHLIEASFLNNTTFYKLNGDWYTYDQLQALPNAEINFIGGFLYGPDGTLLPDAQGGFTYRGENFVNEELTEVDGVLFANSTEFGLIPVGLSFGTMFDLVGEVGGDSCFAVGTPILLPGGVSKPIEELIPGDVVQSYDAFGRLVPGRVTRTFRNAVSHILDVHGLKVTPGHATLCGEGLFKGRHVPIIDILLSDGALVRADGTLMRMAINAPVGSVADAFVKVACALTSGDMQADTLTDGEMRVGTLLFDRDGAPVSVLDCLLADGYFFDAETGLVAKPGEAPHPLFWFGRLPRPEDYILTRSQETLEGILTGGEWEGSQSELIYGRLRQTMAGRVN